MDSRKGTFVIVVGSSGSGKGTLIQHIKTLFPEVLFPNSCVTRPMREGEMQGFPYQFLSVEEFKKRIASGDFIEWAQFSGQYYGTPKESIVRPIEEGKIILKEIEVQGARILLEKLPRENLVIIFIDAGNWDEYAEARLKRRAPISDDEIEIRRMRYEDEMTFKEQADFVISNRDGKLEQAKRDFENIIRSIIQ